MYIPIELIALIMGIMLIIVIILVSTIFNHIDGITLEFSELIERIRKTTSISELTIIEKELDELPIVFRTKHRGRAIIRLSKIIKIKKRNLKKH